MSRKRNYWTKMNLDDARESIEVMDDGEVGRWFRSWIIGAGGKDIPADRIDSWLLEQRAGYAAGLASFADAQEFSQKQRDRVSSRYTGKLPQVTAVQSGSSAEHDLPTGSLPIQQPTTNNQQPAATRARELVKVWNAAVAGTPIATAAETYQTLNKVSRFLGSYPEAFEDFRDAAAFVKGDDFFQGRGRTHFVAHLDYLLKDGKAGELAAKHRARTAARPRIHMLPPDAVS